MDSGFLKENTKKSLHRSEALFSSFSGAFRLKSLFQRNAAICPAILTDLQMGLCLKAHPSTGGLRKSRFKIASTFGLLVLSSSYCFKSKYIKTL